MKRWFAPLCALLLCGCTLVSSNTTYKDDTTSAVVYYLPKRLLQVEFSRKAATATAADVDAAGKKQAAAKTTETTKNQAVKDAEARSKKGLADKVAKEVQDGFDHQLARAKVDAGLATEARKQADADLDKVKAEVAAKALSKDAFVDTFTITALPAVADPTHRFVASLTHQALRSDDFDVKTTQAGLLSNSTVQAEDESGQVLVTLVQAYAGFAGVAAVNAGVRTFSLQPQLPKKPEVKKACGFDLADQKPFDAQFIVDPAATVAAGAAKPVAGQPDPGLTLELTDINKALQRQGAMYRIERTRAWNGTLPASGIATDSAHSGFYYRRTLPYFITVSKCANHDDSNTAADYVQLKQVAFDMPNESPIEFVALRSQAFVKTKVASTFQDGMLVEQQQTQPSEALGLVKIPVDIANALIQLPAQIFSLKVDLTNKATALTNAQTDQIKAITAQQQALKDQQQAQAPTTAAGQ